jgi:hypothetical protein
MEAPFTIEYEGLTATVTEHEVQEMRVFRITFIGLRKPLVITVAETAGGKKWWTSVPQGRQKEAEEVGRRIVDFIRASRKEKQ